LGWVFKNVKEVKMYSEELEKDILDKWAQATEVIPKTLDDLLKAAETPFQITKEV